MLYVRTTESTLVKEVRIAKFTKPEQSRERGMPGAQHDVLSSSPDTISATKYKHCCATPMDFTTTRSSLQPRKGAAE